MSNPKSYRRTLVALGAVALFTACSDVTSTDNTTPTQQITTDSAGSWVYVRFDDVAEKVTVSSPTTSTAWHIAFMGTSVMLNGGAAGPGGVKGYCICQNGSPTNEQIAAMSPSSELADFESVTAANIPASSAFVSDEIDPALSAWYTGSGASATADAGQTFLISQGTGSARLLGKLHVTALASPTSSSPGTVTVEWAIQTTAGGAFGPTHTATFSTADGPAYIDLNTNASASSSDWDLKVDGWLVQLNSGASGTGTWKALSAERAPFASITTTFAAMPPEQTFRTDVFGGVFATNRWYRYNVTGADNQIWPTYNVYLLAIGDEVYKVQLISYYSEAGSGRFYTVRYARVR